jgi:hypothetical protein
MLDHNWRTIMADVAATRKMIFDNSDNTEIYRNHLKRAIETRQTSRRRGHPLHFSTLIQFSM